jgi:trimethylamine--corrinoid protein Co-methyltransferase
VRHIRSSINVLSDREIESIHRASLEVLREVGVSVANDWLLDRLQAAGAEVRGDRVQLPEPTIQRMLAETTQGKRRTRASSVSRSKVRADSATQILMVDYPDFRRRPGTLADIVKGIVLANALPTIGSVLPIVVPSDVPLSVSEIESYRLGCLYSRKPFHVVCFGPATCPYLLEMAAVTAAATGRSRRELGFSFSFGVVSPLRFARDDLTCALRTAREGWPASCYSYVVVGATGPASMAGALVLSNAERLACLTLMWLWGQLGYRDGEVPDPCMIDPRTMAPSFGHPNLVTLAVAEDQLRCYYGLGPGGGLALSDAKLIDFESGFERGVGAAFCLLSGGAIGPSGIAGTDEGASLEKMVIEDAALSSLAWTLAGIDVNHDSLALDIIKQVGIGGSYLDQPHTARYLRREFWSSPLFPRESWAAWEKNGRQTLLERAHCEVERILAVGYPPKPLLPDSAIQQLDDIAARARSELAGAGSAC